MCLNICLTRVYSGAKMTDLVGRKTIKELFGVPVEGGDVYIYQIKTGSDDPFSSNFYIATFYNKSDENEAEWGEVVWGVGSTIMSALNDAEINWEREKGAYDNPFREAIEIVSNIIDVDLTGEVTIKEVDTVDVGDGRVSVYEVKRDSDDLYFDDFYIATFTDISGEEIWGVGRSPKSALKNAEIEWDKIKQDYNNPFKKALEILNEESNGILYNY
jgi:hypothetical protein